MCEHEGLQCPGRNCRCECMNCMMSEDEVTTWYVDSEATHGEPGLFGVLAMTPEDIAEMNEPAIGQLGPDYVIEGTIDDVVEWLEAHDCKTLDTDDFELSLLWKKRNG